MEIPRIDYVDDLDGKPVDPTELTRIEFEVRMGNKKAMKYRIDLRPASVEKFEKAINRFVSNATKLPTTTQKRTPSRTGSSAVADPKLVRGWALSNGFEVASRGTIPTHIVKAYNAAN